MTKSNPVKEMMGSSSYCEATSIGKTRRDKTCNLCSNLIPKGSAHTDAKIFCDEYTQVNFCNDCEEEYSYQLTQMRAGKYDEI